VDLKDYVTMIRDLKNFGAKNVQESFPSCKKIKSLLPTATLTKKYFFVNKKSFFVK
jgi:hypothetical protein